MRNISTKNIISAAAAVLCIVLLAVVVAGRLAPDEAESPAELSAETADIVPAETEAPAGLEAIDYSIVISEVMPQNHAALMTENGAFPDYIELYNSSAEEKSLSGMSISDKAGGEGWPLPDTTLKAGEYMLVYADGADVCDASAPHADFSLAADETVYLLDKYGRTVDTISCAAAQPDAVMAKNAEGEAVCSLYPTPGYANTPEGYEAWQSTLTAGGPIVINEVVVQNYNSVEYRGEREDWIEIKNISASPVELSQYYISDDDEDLFKYNFPEYSIQPGEKVLVISGFEGRAQDGSFFFSNFSLDSQHEQLYLSSESRIVDYVSVRDIPYDCSMGRVSGKNGFFYFDTLTPMQDNEGGYRYVASSPVTLTQEGSFDDTPSLTVELSGDGEIYYTLDGTVPTAESAKYTAPITINQTTIVRAVSAVQGAMTSRPATFSYFLNENVTLPIVSLVVDDIDAYQYACRTLDKTYDLPGNVSLYEEDGAFNIGCTVKLTGQASLGQPKKGMRVKFSGAFGDSVLDYDVFDTGFDSYRYLSLRTGNDNIKAYIKNEVCQELMTEFSDKVLSQSGKYCIVYLNGQYNGIYCLKEKINAQYVADQTGVSKQSVELTDIEEMEYYRSGNTFYHDVYEFITYNDMADSANYDKVCSLMDIDSFIDWAIMENYAGNWDILHRNIRVYRSAELDNKWRFIYYDLDHAFLIDYYAFRTVYNIDYAQSTTAQMMQALLHNEDFKLRYLTRCCEALKTVLTNEHVLAKIEELQAVIAPEVERDCLSFGRTLPDYESYAKALRDFIQTDAVDYNKLCIKQICDYLLVTEDYLMSLA